MLRKVIYLVTLALLFAGLGSAPDNFVYTNDDIGGPNSVSGFSVASDGSFTLIPGSPFLTGGAGVSGYGYYATQRVTATTVGNFVFASNTASNDVSVFTVDTNTGALTLVPGSPFPVGGSPGGFGIALGVTPNSQFLIAANGGTVTVFSIAGDGTLTPIAGSPFPLLAESFGIAVSPDGRFLALGEGPTGQPVEFQVEMMSIDSDGSLASTGGFPTTGGSVATGVAINCASDLLYLAEANFGRTIVDGYSISTTGSLTPVPGSPFENSLGQNSNVVLLDRIHGARDKLLFVSNQDSDTIESFKLAKGGSLSLVGAFPMHSSFRPAGMATNADGNLLYVANSNNVVSVFSVEANGRMKGTLTEVAGSPFATGQNGDLLSLTSFPPNVCKVGRKPK